MVIIIIVVGEVSSRLVLCAQDRLTRTHIFLDHFHSLIPDSTTLTERALFKRTLKPNKVYFLNPSLH